MQPNSKKFTGEIMTEIKFEPDKFIVINRKHLEELTKLDKEKDFDFKKEFNILFECFVKFYKTLTGNEFINKYYVCNQDEPYAQKVLDVILEGERAKEILNTQQGPL